MRRISLDGEWILNHFEEGSLCLTHPDQLADAGLKPLPALVPGNIELDLMRAGELPDLYHGENIHHLRPYEFHEWWYRRSFKAPPISPGQTVELVFEGLDCFAAIWLNGEEAGRTANMLITHRFDVTRLLRSGADNKLAIRVYMR